MCSVKHVQRDKEIEDQFEEGLDVTANTYNSVHSEIDRSSREPHGL